MGYPPTMSFLFSVCNRRVRRQKYYPWKIMRNTAQKYHFLILGEQKSRHLGVEP